MTLICSAAKRLMESNACLKGAFVQHIEPDSKRHQFCLKHLFIIILTLICDDFYIIVTLYFDCQSYLKQRISKQEKNSLEEKGGSHTSTCYPAAVVEVTLSGPELFQPSVTSLPTDQLNTRAEGTYLLHHNIKPWLPDSTVFKPYVN